MPLRHFLSLHVSPFCSSQQVSIPGTHPSLASPGCFCTSRYPTGNAFSLSVVSFSYFRFQFHCHLPREVLPKKTCQYFASLSYYLPSPSIRWNSLNWLHIGKFPTGMPVSWERDSRGGVPPNASTIAFPPKKSHCYRMPMSRIQILPLRVISWSDGTSTRSQNCLKI